MIPTGVPPEVLARAARIYKTNKDAGAALGMSMRGFARACRRHGIETPHSRYRKERGQVPST